MWFLSFIPTAALEFVINAVITLGLVGLTLSFFLSLIPVPINKVVLQVISVAVLVTGIYWKGGIEVEKEWRTKVEAAEARAKLAEEKAASANAQVEYVFLDRVKTVKETQVVIQERIKDISIKMDENCKIIPEVVDIHNQAVRNKTGAKK